MMKREKLTVRSFHKSSPSFYSSKTGSSFPLVCVDNKTIRRSWETHYLNLQDRLEEVQSKLHHFMVYEKPTYTKWVESTFPKETAELKKIESAIADIKQLIFEIEIDSLFHNRGIALSCHFLLQKRKKKKGANGREEKREAPVEDLSPADQGLSAHKERDRKASHETKLKTAFRAIARLLHPDANHEISPEKMERWYAAQMAYKAKDLELLESLYYLEEKQLDSLPIALIQKRIAILDKTLHKKTRELESCLGHPAWGFSQLQVDEQYTKKIKGWMNEKIREKKKELFLLNKKMKRWKQEAKWIMAKKKGDKKLKKRGP
ncbi:Conserved hypothetical protein [Methylacidiphilum infernorum V4]|uniref:J domain-containing protein n=2 Tax=Candidatus Methylacidiphilum infernorum TaxID=511746 RepID=B3E122_METI4|nr:Conserved hypothetical protein [Methylacidiphilum infernorum V4]